MGPRSLEQSSQELQAKFEEIIGSRSVYYNPPASVRMTYPAIVFTRANFNTLHADDSAYLRVPRYEVTVITNDPDDSLIMDILALPKCSFDRHFVSENLHHNVFTLYY